MTRTREGTAENCDAYHFVESGELCYQIAERYGITVAQFVEWNPIVGASCAGLWAEYWYCVSVVGVDPTIPTTAGPSPTGGNPSAPSPTRAGTAENCDEYRFVKAGDICADIIAEYRITLAQFVEWNPVVGPSCSGLWAEYWYCVSVEGHEPSTPPTTTTTSSSSPAGPTAPAPTQPGIVGTCDSWHVAVSGDTCFDIAAAYGISQAQFGQWNPAVGSNCGGLWLGYAYCVGTSDQGGSPTPTPTQPTGCAAAPSPTQPGASCDCDRWHLVESGDDCWRLYQQYGITEGQFSSWNPGVNCNLWLGYNVCVRA